MVPLPGTADVTLKAIVHVEFAGLEPPVSVTEFIELVIVPPLHCGVAGVPNTVKLAGIVSVKLTPVSGVALLFESTIVTVLLPPRTMVVGEYVLVPVRTALTLRLPEAGNKFVTPGTLVVNEFAGIVFVRVPEMDKFASTVTVIVQVESVGGVALAGMVPPVKVIDVALLVKEPPQVVVGAPETVKPVGRLSVRLTFV